jgi:hypothetical protein
VHKGWTITFRKNIHMYCHLLKLTKGNCVYEVQCEDLPMSNGLVGMWPFALNLEGATYQDLLSGLREWAGQSGMKYRIYTRKNQYETNEATP